MSTTVTREQKAEVAGAVVCLGAGLGTVLGYLATGGAKGATRGALVGAASASLLWTLAYFSTSTHPGSLS